MIWQTITGLAIALIGTITLLTFYAMKKTSSKQEAWELLKSWVTAPRQDTMEDQFFGKEELPHYRATSRDLIDESILDRQDEQENRLTLQRVAAMRNADNFIAHLDDRNRVIPSALISLREDIDCVPAADAARIKNLIVRLNAEVRLTRMGATETDNTVL